MERTEMLKAFDETCSGVKGLVDSGFQKVPEIFMTPSNELAQDFPRNAQIQVPVIDLSGINEPERRKQIVEEVRIVSETWGYFQVVNHGIPLTTLDVMLDGVRKFHEQDVEEKKEYYSRDCGKLVTYNSNYDLFITKTAEWKDTLNITFADGLEAQDLPPSCRDSSIEYSKHVETLVYTMHGILSEALGLKTNHLENMECPKGHSLHCHYYPPCPEPELAIGAAKHSDPGFLTIVLQDQSTNSLQVLYQDQWVDVQPISGGLVVVIGDLLQLISNGKFKSREHRVTASNIGPRISVACFISGPCHGAKVYGPINELVSEENPAIYKYVLLSEHMNKFLTFGLDNYHVLDYYKV